MTFEFERLNRRPTDDELIADLKAVAAMLGKSCVTRSEQDSLGKFHSATIWRRFGDWPEAHSRAGLELTKAQKNAKVSDEELFENLETVWRALGRQPRAHEMIQPLSHYDFTTYKRRYGTWLNALEVFSGCLNPEKFVELANEIPCVANSAQRKRRTPRGVNWRLRFLVMRRDLFRCTACGRSPALSPGTLLHVDHINAWANGGETEFENLQTLCNVCNLGKGDLL